VGGEGFGEWGGGKVKEANENAPWASPKKIRESPGKIPGKKVIWAESPITKSRETMGGGGGGDSRPQ